MPAYGLEPGTLTEKYAQEIGLSDSERATYNRLLAESNEKFMASVRALYKEVTGDTGGNFDLMTLQSEIRSKSRRDDSVDNVARLSQRTSRPGRTAEQPRRGIRS